MDHQLLQEILSSIERPSRYMGTEKNAVHKSIDEVKLHIALAFPDLYEIGTSHFGMQILYHLLNSCEDIYAERVFAPGHDLEGRLRASRTPLFSLESKTPLNRFHIVGFSLLYELNYTNILNMLELSNIPFYAEQRDLTHPMIIAGGPCTCNPEPVADFFDAMVVGDGESAMMEMVRKWLIWFTNPPLDKEHLLRAWSTVEGVYIPSFFEIHTSPNGVRRLEPRFSEYNRVKRAVEPDLDRSYFPESPVVPYGKPVHDRLRLEIARGCTRGCRFCQAGMIYRPVRERSVAHLCRIFDKSIRNTGYDDLSLLSLSSGDYAQLEWLMDELTRRCKSKRTAISLPSLRADSVSAELMQAVKKIRKTGFTFAPEAGSQRLRRVINKNLSEQEIFGTVENAFQQGWRLVKLYFMVGLPTETTSDVDDIVKLIEALRKIKRPDGAYGRLNVSVATFIPKPHTPFQWTPQLTLSESRDRIDRVKRKSHLPGVRFKYQPPEVSLIEGLCARGNRALASLLVQAFRSGCRHDGWSDQFKFETWQRVCAESGIDVDRVISRRRDLEEPLPWDHIDIGVDGEFLRREYLCALEERPTADCRHGDCHVCGVCDFERLAPVLSSTHTRTHAIDFSIPEKPDIPRSPQKVTLVYRKMEQARYFSQLEMVNIFSRAVHQADIPVKYSQGFHPKPKLSFSDPLPVGIESEQEYLTITLQRPIQATDLMAAVNRYLPQGLDVITCTEVTGGAAPKMPMTTAYTIKTRNGVFDPQAVRWFEKSGKVVVQRTNKKGRVTDIDLKKAVVRLELTDQNTLQMVVHQQASARIRPFEVLKHVFQIDNIQMGQMRIVKKATADARS